MFGSDADADEVGRYAGGLRKVAHERHQGSRRAGASALQDRRHDSAVEQSLQGVGGDRGQPATGLGPFPGGGGDGVAPEGSASSAAAATASWTARLMPTPPIGDMAWAASPMHSCSSTRPPAVPVGRGRCISSATRRRPTPPRPAPTPRPCWPTPATPRSPCWPIRPASPPRRWPAATPPGGAESGRYLAARARFGSPEPTQGAELEDGLDALQGPAVTFSRRSGSYQ
jgi:hypothetical protein